SNVLIRPLLHHLENIAEGTIREIVRKRLSRAGRIESFEAVHRVPVKKLARVAVRFVHHLLYTEEIARHINPGSPFKRRCDCQGIGQNQRRKATGEQPAAAMKREQNKGERKIPQERAYIL